MNERSIAFLGGGRWAKRSSQACSARVNAPRTRSSSRAGAKSARRSSPSGHSVATTLDNAEACRFAGVLVLMAKPQDFEVLLQQIADHVTTDHLVVTFAAGIRTSFVEQHLAPDVPVVRVMSNVPVMVDEAMSVIAPGRYADDKHLAVAEELLASVGKVLRLEERYLDAVTATSGSGPAYFFLLAEAMIEACILLGLSRDVASQLIIQTMLGSAKMLRDTGTHPVELRARW